MATENAVMTYNDAGYQLPLTISGSGSYNYLLRTKDTYLNKDITVTTSTAAAVPEADNANADVTLFTTDGSNAGVNISPIVKTKATTEPTSGYYLAFKGSGRSKITTAGWIGTGALNTSTSGAKYFPITAAEGEVIKTGGTISPSVTLTQSDATNVTLSTSNTSGVSVKATGNGSVSNLAIAANITTAGYVPQGNNFATASNLSISAASTSATITRYITAVDIASGKSFTVTNAGTLTVTSTGTTTVTSGSTSAGTVTIVAKKTANDSSNTTANVVTNGLWQQATIKSPDTTATLGNPTYQTSGTNSGKFTILASGTIAKPTVNPAGYVNGDDTIGIRQTGNISGTKVLNKIALKATSNSTLTYQPSIARQTPASGETWVDAASGAATTPNSAPQSGVYVKVKSQANTGTITVSPAVKTDGYGTTSQFTKEDYTGTIGASASADTYIPIQTGSAAVTASQSITKNPDISFPASGTLRATYSGNKSITGTVSTAGWITSVTAATVTTSGTKDVTSLALPATYNFTLTTTAGASGDNTGFTITNNAYRKITITNNANGTTAVTNSGTVTVTNSGTTTVTSGIASSTPKGTINVNAYPTSGTTLDGSKAIVSGGRWVCTPTFNGAGTYYGKITISAGTISGVTSEPTDVTYETPQIVLQPGGWLKMTAGYYKATKISLATLVPDSIEGKTIATAAYIHPSYGAFDADGNPIAGAMTIYGGAYTITT